MSESLKLLHLTPKKNYNSILKYGLIPSKVKLSHHLERFNNDGLNGDKATYLWDPNQGGETDKMIKDFIYCKHFTHPRNNLIDYTEALGLDDVDFKKMGSKLFGEEEDYVLLEINADNLTLLDDEYIHEQSSDGDNWSTNVCMNPKYEHNDKILRIGFDIIIRDNIKIINEISTRFYKDNTIGISYKKI